MWKVIGCVFSCILIISGIIGLINIPENIDKWVSITLYLSMKTTSDQDFFQWIFLIVGMLILYISSGVYKKVWPKSKSVLRIDFDENNPDYYYQSEDFELLSYSFGRNKVFDGYDENLTYLRLCRISVYNSSEKETIEGVEVQLTKIDKFPDILKGVLSMHLQLKDDRNGQTVFDLSPQNHRYVDVVMWKLTPEKATPEYEFCNVLKDVGDRSVPIHNSKTEYKITIQVTGKKTRRETRDFKVGMVNKDNTFEKIWIWPVD